MGVEDGIGLEAVEAILQIDEAIVGPVMGAERGPEGLVSCQIGWWLSEGLRHAAFAQHQAHGGRGTYFEHVPLVHRAVPFVMHNE